jgi:hypothetical protein
LDRLVIAWRDQIHRLRKNRDCYERQSDALFADRPFYGPPKPVATYVLWNLNRNTLFMASVPTTIPLILDGNKARFGDLKPGQYVVVEYELVLDYPIIYCAATRIDAHSARPAKDRAQKKRK